MCSVANRFVLIIVVPAGFDQGGNLQEHPSRVERDEKLKHFHQVMDHTGEPYRA